MNSTPADSKARRTARSLAAVIEVSASVSSARRIVATPSEERAARSSALQRIRARPALIWALVNGGSFRLAFNHIDMIFFISYDLNHPETRFWITEESMKSDMWTKSNADRRAFIGGSDARIIMGDDEAALLRLWREKRGEVEPEDLSANLIVQLGTVTEHLNRHWYERNTGQVVTEVQRQVFHPVKRWMAATLDGMVEGTGAVFEAKFMLPWSFSEEAAAEKHMAQLQHNMWVTASRTAVLSIITGGGKWVEMTIPADPLYQHLLLTAEKKFWRCVQTGETPRLFGVEPPRPRIEAVRIVDMSGSNAWAEFAGLFPANPAGVHGPRAAKAELKALVPEDAKEATATASAPSARSRARSASTFMERRPPCSAPVNTIGASARRSPRRKPSSPIRKSRSSPPSRRRSRARGIGPFAMPRCPAASTSCANAWASMRSRPSRPPRSTRTPA